MPYIGNNHIVGDHVNNFKVLDDISSHTATFDGSATSVVSTSDKTIRIPEHRFIQGQRVTYNNGGGGNIGGLSSGTAYYVTFDTAHTIKLATSLNDANNNTNINLSSVGSGTAHTLTAAFDGINTKFKLTHGSGETIRVVNPTQLNIAINNVIQRPNINDASFSEGFAITDTEKIVFKIAPTVNDIFWGSLIGESIETFDITDHRVDNFTGDGSETEFTLSGTVPNNDSIIVTINGVVQHPSDSTTARSYSLVGTVLVFTSAPAIGDEIQVRHIGFAGSTTGGVSGFYGRTGNVALNSNDHITTGDITARNFKATGITTFGTANFSTANFSGDVSIGGTLTYEDVTNIDAVGLITARDGIKVGVGITLDTIGDAEFCGVVTFNNRRGGMAAHFPNNEMLVFGNSYLYGNIRNTGSQLTFDALNTYAFNCWDGNSMEKWLGVSGVGGVINLGGYNMGTGSAKAPRLSIQGSNHLLKMYSSDPSSTTLTERFSLSQSGFNFTGLSTHTGNFDLDGDITVGTGVTIETNGQATFVGIVTFGSGSTTIDNNVVNVGTALTLGHTQGVQFHTQNLHSQGFEVNQINASGIITALSFRGDGAQLTGIVADKIFEGNTEIETIDTGSDGHIKFTTEGSERLRIDSVGRVMIGTTTEGNGNADEFTISYINHAGVSGGDQGRCGMTIRSGDNTSGVTQNGYIYFSDGTSGANESKGVVAYEHSNDAMYFSTDQVERLRISSTGAVQIGTGTGTGGGGLAVYGGTVNQASGQDATFYVRADSTADWGILLQKAHEYGMRINSNSSATLAFAIYDQSNTQRFKIEGDGDVVAQGTVDSASDIKLKTNIKTIDNALDKVLQLRGAEYDRIDKDNHHEIGVIAQEVEKVIPELVHGDETKTVSYGNMVAVLIEAIKEQNEVINKMKKEIEDLKG